MFVFFMAWKSLITKEQEKYIYIYIVSHHPTNALFMMGKSNCSPFFFSIGENMIKKKGIDWQIKERIKGKIKNKNRL